MSAKLSSSLPKGEANGLAAIARQLAERPEDVHVLLVLVDCSRITTDTDTGDVVPTARVRRVEAISDPADGRTLRKLLRREWERRTGKTVLPFELEEDLRIAFGEDTGS